jgi:predicted phosphate transport protein (TIGR00153 family)
MSSLFEWFKSRNEESAINKIFIHMQKVLECVVEFEKALSYLIEEKNIDLALKVLFRVTELEHQADGIRRNILNMLSKAELPARVHQNLTQLANRIDDIANATNASARILIYLDQTAFQKLENDVHQKMLEIVRISVIAIKKLNLMVNKLISSEDVEIHRLGEEVNKLEHQCDELHFAINRLLVSNNPIENAFIAIEIHDCIDALETITDNAEDVADYIIMLTATKRG